MERPTLTSIRTMYFSATGTTEQVVRTLGDSLSRSLHIPAKHFSFTSIGSREIVQQFSQQELVLIGVPVYAGRVPNVLLPYLTEKLRGEHTPVIPIVLYGNRNYDDALIELTTILEQKGFVPFAAAAMIGEHSFSTTLAAGRPDEEDLRQLEEFGQRISETLLTALQLSPVTVPGHDPIGPYYTPRDRKGAPVNILKVKPLTDPERCIQCSLCAQLCPMGSIDSNHVSDVSGICIKCCACVKKCPAGAKYFDDENYLYHQHELEAQFSRRAEPEFFL